MQAQTEVARRTRAIWHALGVLHSRATRPRDRLDRNLWIGQGLCPECIHAILPESAFHPFALVDHRLQGIGPRNQGVGIGRQMFAPRTNARRFKPAEEWGLWCILMLWLTFLVTSPEKPLGSRAAKNLPPTTPLEANSL